MEKSGPFLRWVDTSSAEERASVLNLRVGGCNQHRESDDGEGHGDHVADSTLAGPVGDVTNENGHRGGDSIWRDGKKLSLSTSVAHTSQNGWKEQREGVEWAEVAHVDDRVAPRLPVLECGKDVAFVVLLAGARLLVGSKSAADTKTLIGGEESRGIGL